MKYLSLFSGIGGFELGIQQAYEETKNKGLVNTRGQVDTISRRQETLNSTRMGDTHDVQPSYGSYESVPVCVGFSEIDKYATQIYQKHFPNHKNYGDITQINERELPDFDFLCGGFPCQSFSIAGKRGGFSDTRGTMFFEIERILNEKKPRLLLLENVKGLLSHENGNTFKTIISTLDELGYDLQWQVLNSKNFGVPQNRERVFIVGHLRGTSRPKVFPIGESNGDNQEANSKYPSISAPVTGQGQLNCRGVFIQQFGEFRESQISPTLRTPSGGNRLPMVKEKTKIRRLTPIECERLQGFPDGWTASVSDSQRYKCLGNAVTVNVIKAIVDRL